MILRRFSEEGLVHTEVPRYLGTSAKARKEIPTYHGMALIKNLTSYRIVPYRTTPSRNWNIYLGMYPVSTLARTVKCSIGASLRHKE